MGLVAANYLAQRNVPVTVMEAEPALPENLRASTFHPPTLDILDQLGIGEEFLRMGLKAPTLQYRERSGCIAEFDFSLLRDATKHPYRLQCEQFKLNHLLMRNLRSMPAGRICFRHKVMSVTQTKDTVSVQLEACGTHKAFTGRYLVAADGARSIVRDSLGIAFPGITWAERFLVVSTPFDFADHIPGLAFVSYFADPEEWYFLLRVPGLWRVMFPTKPEETDASVLSDSSVERRLQRVLNRRRRYEIRHRVLYGVHQRVAATYRKGRVFLAGDAAHINNPLGGMGMNGGIHDALNLAEKIACVWQEKASPGELDRYERQRRPIALEYVDVQTRQNKRNLETSDPEEQQRFRDTIREIAANPQKAYDYLLQVSMIKSLRQAAALG